MANYNFKAEIEETRLVETSFKDCAERLDLIKNFKSWSQKLLCPTGKQSIVFTRLFSSIILDGANRQGS